MVIHERPRSTPAPRLDGSGVCGLRPEDVARLPLTWYHRHDRGDVRRLLRVMPGRSVWRPDTGEFALIGPWRHRSDVVQLVELSAQRSAPALMEYAAATAGRLGASLLVTLENEERRRPSFYDAIAFEHIEDVVTMELAEPRFDPADLGRLRFVRVEERSDDFDEIREIDNRAFPWLWRNSGMEFSAYARMPDVELYAGLDDGWPVSYYGVTIYNGWGHLDRIAVRPELHGRGVGRATLAHATSVLLRAGSEAIGLSTQGHNHASQRLYERYGFTRRPDNDYRIYGRALAGNELSAVLATGYRPGWDVPSVGGGGEGIER